MARQGDPSGFEPLYLPSVQAPDITGFEPLYAPSPTQPQQPEPSVWSQLASPGNAAAFALSGAGDFIGGLIPPLYAPISFAGGALGEAARQGLSGEDWNFPMMGVEGGLNLIPGPRIPGASAGLKDIGKYALKSGGSGAVQGFLGATPRHIASTGEWELPSSEEVVGQTLGGFGVGAVTGGALAGAHAGYGRLKGATPSLPIEAAPPSPLPLPPNPGSPYGAPRGYGYVEPASTFPEIPEGTSGKIADMSLEELQALLNLAKQPGADVTPTPPFGAGIGQAGEGAGTGGFEWGKGEAPKSPYFGPNQTPLRPDGVIELDEKLSTPKTVAGLEADGYTNVGKNEKGQNIFKKLFSGDEGTFDPQEMWNNLKRLLGRDPTPEEVDAGMRRQPGPDEPTGRVAQFPSNAVNLFEVTQNISQEFDRPTSSPNVIEELVRRAKEIIDVNTNVGELRSQNDRDLLNRKLSKATTDYNELQGLADRTTNNNAAGLFQELADTLKEKANLMAAAQRADDARFGFGRIRPLDELLGRNPTPQGPVISTLDRLYDAVDNASDFKSLNNLRTEILSHYQQAPTGSDAKRVLADMLDDVSTKMRDIPGPRPVQEGIDQPRPIGEGGGPRDIDLGTQPNLPGKGLFGGEEGSAPVGMFGGGWLKGLQELGQKYGVGMGSQPPPKPPTLQEQFPHGAPIGYGWQEDMRQPPRPPLPKKKEGIVEKVIGASVASTTTGDLSAGFRQGLSQIFTKEWRKAAGKMFSALRNQANADAIEVELRGRDIHKASWDSAKQKVIPSMADRMELPLIKGSDVSGSEMGFAESLIEKVPILGKHYFKPTNRAYATFLNVLRTEMAEKLVKESVAMAEEAATGRARMPGVMGGVKLPDFLGGGRTPGFSQEYTPKEAADLNPLTNNLLAKDMGKYIGNATGRGNLGALEKHASWLRYLLFSPRLVASRINMLNPATYMMATPYVRKQYLKSAIATGAAWTTFSQIAKMASSDVTVSDDPDSADFGKVRIGNTRLDPGGGFQQFLVNGHRLWSGGATSSAAEPGTGVWHRFGSGYQATTSGENTQRFFANKLNPAVKFAYDIAFAATGYQKLQVGDRIIQSFVPLFVQDLFELAQKEPQLLPGLAPFIAGGMGTQTYEKGEVESRFLSPENDWTITGGGIRDIFSGHPTPSEQQDMTTPGQPQGLSY